MTSEEKLGSMSLWKLMLSMGMPALAAQLINLIYNIVDRIYIGHIPEIGYLALTGVGLCMPVIIIISAFAALIGGGGPPRASICLGQDDDRKACSILSGGVSILAVLSVILALIAFITKEPFLYFIGAVDETYVYAKNYLDIYLIGTFFVQVTVGLNPFITAQGKSGTAMISVLIGAILNIILDPIFIFVFDMGVRGAAAATVISQAVSCVWILIILSRKSMKIHIEKKLMLPDKSVMLPVLALGFSPFIMQATESFITIAMSNGLKKYGGGLYVGSLTVFQSIMQIISVPVSAFAQGVNPIMSFNYGAGNTKRVVGVFKRMTVLLVSYTTLFSLCAIVFPRVFVSIFTDNSVLVDICVKYLPVFICGMLVFGFQMCCQNTFVALGQAKLSIVFALLRKVILLIPLSLILPRFVGVFGIYISEPISDFTSAICCTATFAFTIKGILARNPALQK